MGTENRSDQTQDSRIEVPQGVIIHSLEIRFLNPTKGIIDEVQVHYSLRRPDKMNLRGVDHFKPESAFPSLKSLLLKSIDVITTRAEYPRNP